MPEDRRIAGVSSFKSLFLFPSSSHVVGFRATSILTDIVDRGRRVTDIELALRALARIACWSGGAHAVIDAGTLKLLDGCLVSSRTGVCGEACALVGTLALNHSTLAAVLDANACRRLNSLLL